MCTLRVNRSFFIPFVVLSRLMIGICLLFLTSTTHSQSAQPMNQLQGIVNAKSENGSNKDKLHHLQLGMIELYFFTTPIVNVLSHNALTSDATKLELFFPMTKFGSAINTQMLKYQSAEIPAVYSVEFRETTKPIRGVMCSIIYNQHKVSVAYDAFITQQAKGGFAIRFYNKELLGIIKRENAILRTAGRETKNHVA